LTEYADDVVFRGANLNTTKAIPGDGAHALQEQECRAEKPADDADFLSLAHCSILPCLASAADATILRICWSTGSQANELGVGKRESFAPTSGATPGEKRRRSKRKIKIRKRIKRKIRIKSRSESRGTPPANTTGVNPRARS
jgi:hypothetical protein